MKKLLLFLYLFYLIGYFNAFAQGTWQKTYGGSSSDFGYDIQQTTDGGFIIAGSTYSFGAGYSDVYLIKTNANGDTLWTKTFGGSGYENALSVQQTIDGGIIIAGWTNSFGSGGYDIYLIKTDSNGDTLWTKTFGNTQNEWANEVQQTSDDGYIITGYNNGDVYLIKTDANGNQSWAKTFDKGVDEGKSVKQTTDGGYVILGSVNIIRYYLGASYDDRQIWIIKTDSAGQMQWEQLHGNTPATAFNINNESGNCIQQTTNGGYIITGYEESGSVTFTSGADVLLFKTDSNGNVIWSKYYGELYKDDIGYCLQQTNDGGYVLTGATASYGAGGVDVLIIKTDTIGNVQSLKTFGGTYDDVGYSVMHNNAEYVVTGYTSSFGSGSHDVYLIKTFICPIITASISHTKPGCYGGNDGSATVSASGGKSPYSYFWSNTQTTQTATGLSAGSYNVTITDSLGCFSSFNLSITDPSTIITSIISQTKPSCYKGNDGSVTVSASMGKSPYSYFWSNAQTNQTATGLSAGSYNVTITDLLGCSSSYTIKITDPSPFISSIISQSNVSYYGGNDGSATITSSGSIIETFEATNSWVIVNGTETNKWFIGTATSNGGSKSIYISDNSADNVYDNSSNSVVHFYKDITFPANASNIKIQFDWKGYGESGYDYLKVFLVPTTTTLNAGTQLSSGQIGNTYNLENDFITTTITGLDANAGLTKRLVFSWKNDGNSGSQPPAAIDNIIIKFFEASTSYSYKWNTTPSQISATATGLYAGNYIVTITDSKGCTDMAFVEISQPLLAPANDYCLNAIQLIPDTICFYYDTSTVGATNSPTTPTPVCANFLDGSSIDVWFSFIATSTIHQIDTYEGTITDGGMALYSGTCGSLLLIDCNDDSSQNGYMPLIDRNDFIIGNTYYIRFWSYTPSYTGTFGICVTATMPYCNGLTTLVDCTGNINDGSGVNDYMNYADCSWLIQPTGANSITLTFTQFDTESNYDSVTVYDGSTISSAILGSFHGDSLPPIITSSGGSMLIVFTSDKSVTKSGWAANYSCSTISTNSIAGIVKDAGINFSSGTLDFNNCNGCIVELYQGSSLISTQSTNSNGFYSFDNLTGTNYKIIGKKTGNSFSSQVAFDKINPGTNVNDLKIPFTLIQQANTLIDSLSTKTFSTTLFYGLVPISTVSKGYNEAEIQNLINGWQNIQSDYDDIVNSLSRLIIAQQALKEFSDDAAIMTAEGIVSAYDFGESIVSLVTIKNKLDNVISSRLSLIKKIKKYTITLAIKMIKFIVLQSWNYIPNTEFSASAKTHFQGIIDFLITLAESKKPDDFQENFAQDALRDIITTYATPVVYGEIYVPHTQNNVVSTYNNAATFNYTGSFTDTYNNVIHNSNNNSLVDISHQKTVETVTRINNWRDVSGFADKAGDITQIAALATSFFDGGTLLTISTILQGIEVGASGFAMGSAFYRMYKITKEVPNATLQSFRKTGKDIRKPYPYHFLFTSSSNLSNAIDNYNNHLYDIQNYITNGERKIAIAKMDSLIILDSLLQNVWMEAVTPIYAAAPYAIDVIANFDSLYNFTVIKNSGASMLYRQSINCNLIAYLLDSTSSYIIDSLNQNILNTINANKQMDTSIQNMNNEIINIPIPAHITVLSTQYQKTMLENFSYPVKIFYKNIGTINADSVYAKIILRDGFTTLNDSIYIGTIPVSATGNISFTINTPNYDTISYYTVVFNSPNSTSDGIGEALQTVTTMVSGNNGISKNNFTFFVYPNPSIGKFEFGNLKIETGTIEVYNMLGEKVYQAENTNLKSQFDLSSHPSGIYFIRLKTEQGTMNSKIIIQK